jgi:hypothetical protein
MNASIAVVESIFDPAIREINMQGQALCYVGPAVGRFMDAFRPFGIVLLNPRPASAPNHGGNDEGEA